MDRAMPEKFRTTQNWEPKGSFDPKIAEIDLDALQNWRKTAQKSTPHARRRLKISAEKSAGGVPEVVKSELDQRYHKQQKTDTKSP